MTLTAFGDGAKGTCCMNNIKTQTLTQGNENGTKNILRDYSQNKQANSPTNKKKSQINLKLFSRQIIVMQLGLSHQTRGPSMIWSFCSPPPPLTRFVVRALGY
jgi:DNA integrity scanning protein DisA with diadenylate cyclase activity